jgi:hypothetical protein
VASAHQEESSIFEEHHSSAPLEDQLPSDSDLAFPLLFTKVLCPRLATLIKLLKQTICLNIRSLIFLFQGIVSSTSRWIIWICGDREDIKAGHLETSALEGVEIDIREEGMRL